MEVRQCRYIDIISILKDRGRYVSAYFLSYFMRLYQNSFVKNMQIPILNKFSLNRNKIIHSNDFHFIQ